MEFGPALRELRKDRGLSLTALADGIMAKSQLSRFERGESEISVTTFHQLLNRLEILFDEFLVFSEKKENFRTLILTIAPHYTARNIPALQAILKDLENNESAPRFSTTMVKSLISSLDSFLPGPSDEELGQLADYLFGVEYWGQYEITLLGNCAPLLSFETLYLLTVELIQKRKSTLPSDPGNRKLVIQLAINCLEVSIDQKAWQRATMLMKEIEDMLIIESEFFEKVVFEYMKGYYEVRSGGAAGLEKMRSALTVFELMAPTGVYETYLQHFNNLGI